MKPNEITIKTFEDTDNKRNLIKCNSLEDMYKKLGILDDMYEKLGI